MSKGSTYPTIYYMHVRVAFKKAKRISERVMWVVSVFDSLNDIATYSKHTMSRIETEIYGRSCKSKKEIILREVIDKKPLTKSNLTIDEHKRQYNEKV